jgi:hypothetical protein
MKRLPCLSISICLNAFLLGLVLWARVHHSLQPAERTPAAIGQSSQQPLRNRVRSFSPGASNVVEVTETICWSQIESEDYRVYVKNLKAIGCPRHTIRDIIVSDVRELYYRRVQAIVDTVSGQFWELLSKPEEMTKVVDEKGKQLNDLEKERTDLLAELLGQQGEWAALENEIGELERVEAKRQWLDFLPAEKADQCSAIEEKASRRQAEIATRQSLSPEERQNQIKLAKLNKYAELAKLLSPEEYYEYRLRNDPSANFRLAVAGFESNPEELRRIVGILNLNSTEPDPQSEEILNRGYLSPGIAIVPVAPGSIEAQQYQEVALNQLLGDRYAQFQRGQDGRYQEFAGLTERLGLSDELAADAFAMRNAAEAAAGKLRANSNLDPDQRNAALTAIRLETERSFESLLGPDAFSAYQKKSGNWLAGLAK